MSDQADLENGKSGNRAKSGPTPSRPLRTDHRSRQQAGSDGLPQPTPLKRRPRDSTGPKPRPSKGRRPNATVGSGDKGPAARWKVGLLVGLSVTAVVFLAVYTLPAVVGGGPSAGDADLVVPARLFLATSPVAREALGQIQTVEAERVDRTATLVTYVVRVVGSGAAGRVTLRFTLRDERWNVEGGQIELADGAKVDI